MIHTLVSEFEFKKRKIRFWIGFIFSLLLLVLFFAGLAGANGGSANGGSLGAHILENILIVSIDALHPGALGPKSSPHIYSLMEKGVYTLKGQSTDPPLTLVSHTAMFSGLSPKQNKKTDNGWLPGQAGIQGETIFYKPKKAGYSTGYFYSKEKLGFLVNDCIDAHGLSKEYALDRASAYFKGVGKHFCFLHLSGLDQAGPAEGWLSPGYLEELFFIDDELEPLIKMIQDKKNYLIIITSDHGGHGKIHGSDHPEDSRLPLIMISDICDLTAYPNIPYQVTHLKTILDTLVDKTHTIKK